MRIQEFLNSLSIMGQGMAGIFVVTAIIIFAVYLLGKINSKDKDK